MPEDHPEFEHNDRLLLLGLLALLAQRAEDKDKGDDEPTP